MSVLPILKWPDPRLTETCAPVADITPEIETLAADMLETMYAAPGFAAVCAQHELDHLDGVVTFDHLDAETRAELMAEYAAA